MKSRIVISLALISLFSFANTVAFAHPLGVNNRQGRQQKRIRQGCKNDSLTNREAFRLQKQQAKLRWNEAKMRHSGGELTNKEKARLEHQQNNLSQNIYDQKHDGQTKSD